ncbi:hypothetical protein [Dyella sp.]|jgi:Amt family ammonium transporter|uniref:ammonium transporter n=1 Tax=Dyella sp. TaxID=1869338 RepID=UPI002D778210|nr:hypothetical protein [Dyella sp.]HET6431165.1 hypothetical protein [Dyella sp.]
MSSASSIATDTAWTALTAVLLMFMHAGFGFYEAGMCRYKNAVDTLAHNLVILAITLVVFWAAGFALGFGNGHPLMGLVGFFPDLDDAGWSSFRALQEGRHVPLAVAFAFALSLADTPATLIAGTGAERIRLGAVIVLTLLMSTLMFPVAAHWVVGGGWLARRGTPMVDTGSGFVHLTGGFSALAVALALGPRRGRFAPGRRVTDPIPPHAMPMVFLGVFILWLGFFAYNAGFAMTVNGSIGLVIANTALAGGFGSVTAMACAYGASRGGYARLRPTMVGLLTANVAITAAPAVVAPWAAACIGTLAGAAAVGSMSLWARLRVDDPTEYLTMNLVGGALGLLTTGLFASPAIARRSHEAEVPAAGLIYGSGELLLSQCIGALAIGAFAFTTVGLASLALRRKGKLRAPPREEDQGADRSTHGEAAQDHSSGPGGRFEHEPRHARAADRAD